RPQSPGLVAVVPAATRETCAGVGEGARHRESARVALQEVEVTADRALHERYRITAVPAVVMADAAGVVRASFLGPVTATDLWARLAELREPGSVPLDGCAPSEPPA